MENKPSQTNRSVLFGVGGLAIGLVIGLVVLGWWLFPVEWVDFSPEQMGPADQENYLRMAIDSLSVNYNTTAAVSRYQDLGEDGPAILAMIQANPAPQSQTAVQAFSALVGVQPEITAQAAGSGMRTILIVLLILFLLALLGYILYILLFKRKAPAETRTSLAEFPPEMSQPEAAMDMEAGVYEEEPGLLMTEERVEEFSAPETEIEVTEFEDEGVEIPQVEEEGMGTLAAGAGLVAAAAVVAAVGADEPQEAAPETDAEAVESSEGPVEILDDAGDAAALLAGSAALAAEQKLADAEAVGADETSAAPVIDAHAEVAAEEAVSTGVEAIIPAALEYIEGIGPAYAQKLKEIGVNTPQQLLQWGSNPRGRQAIAERSEISGKLILKWVNQIDLYRIKGIGSEYAELLEQSGVDTVIELATRNPGNLYQTLVAVNEAKKLVRKLPVLSQVEDWIMQAKNLPRIITY